MLRLNLVKISSGYKIICSGGVKSPRYNTKLDFKPSNLIGYIFYKGNGRFKSVRGFTLAIDCNQFFYWVSGGVIFSRLLKRFYWLFSNIFFK